MSTHARKNRSAVSRSNAYIYVYAGIPMFSRAFTALNDAGSQRGWRDYTCLRNRVYVICAVFIGPLSQ